MEERMDRIRLKAWLDPEALTEQELMCLQIEQNGFGCVACSTAEVARDVTTERRRRPAGGG
jgi:hypothetical protein